MFKKSFETVLDRLDSDSLGIEKIIAMVLVTIIALGSMVGVFFISDMKSATFNDYKPLYERLEALEANPDSLLDEKANIVVTDEGFEYTVENKECKMTGYFSTDFKLLGNKSEDKAVSVILVIIAALFVGFSVWWGFMIAVYIVMYTIWFIVLICIELNKKLKEKKKNDESSTTEDDEEDETEIESFFAEDDEQDSADEDDEAKDKDDTSNT